MLLIVFFSRFIFYPHYHFYLRYHHLNYHRSCYHLSYRWKNHYYNYLRHLTMNLNSLKERYSLALN